MEDERKREKLEENKTVSFQVCDGAMGTFQFFSLVPECMRPQEDPVPWRHLLLGRNKVSAQETGA